MLLLSAILAGTMTPLSSMPSTHSEPASGSRCQRGPAVPTLQSVSSLSRLAASRTTRHVKLMPPAVPADLPMPHLTLAHGGSRRPGWLCSRESLPVRPGGERYQLHALLAKHSLAWQLLCPSLTRHGTPFELAVIPPAGRHLRYFHGGCSPGRVDLGDAFEDFSLIHAVCLHLVACIECANHFALCSALLCSSVIQAEQLANARAPLSSCNQAALGAKQPVLKQGTNADLRSLYVRDWAKAGLTSQSIKFLPHITAVCHVTPASIIEVYL